MRYSIKIHIMLMAILFILVIFPALALAHTGEGNISGQGGAVTSVEQLNLALGGNHKISGNTVILEENVDLEKTVEIKATQLLTLDLNGKTICYDKEGLGTEGFPDKAFSLKSDMVIDGDGSIETLKDFVAAIEMLECTLTIHNGVIKTTGKDSPAVFVIGAGKSATIEMNNGMLQSSFHTIDSSNGAIVNMTMNDGVTKGNIWLDYPYQYDSNNMKVPDGKNTLQINGGQMERVYFENSKCTIQGGTILQGLFTNNSSLSLYGGKVSGEGLDMEDGNLIMKGGTIEASDSEGLKFYAMEGAKKGKYRAYISGGMITTSKKAARGISINGETDKYYGYVDLKFTGGSIRSATKDSSSAGIYAFGKYATVTLQGTSGKGAYIKGYKYSTYKKGPAVLSVGKNTKVFTPKGSKSSYTSGHKLPKSVKGDMSVKYKK